MKHAVKRPGGAGAALWCDAKRPRSWRRAADLAGVS